jgi:hypothetical protein
VRICFRRTTYDTVDSYYFTEHNAIFIILASFSRVATVEMDKPDEVLGANSRCAHTTTKNRRSSKEDTPVLICRMSRKTQTWKRRRPSLFDVPACAEYAQPQTKANTESGPRVRICFFEKSTDIKSLAPACVNVSLPSTANARARVGKADVPVRTM